MRSFSEIITDIVFREPNARAMRLITDKIPKDIDDKECVKWTRMVFEKLVEGYPNKSVGLWETIDRTCQLIELDDWFYNAECLRGVFNHEQLTPQPICRINGNNLCGFPLTLGEVKPMLDL